MKKSFFLFLSLLGYLAAGCNSSSPTVVVEYPVVKEITLPEMAGADSLFLVLSGKFGINETMVYTWENHRLIYDFPKEAADFESELAAVIPQARVKTYEDPYYIFDRSNCDTGQIDTPWAHKILTANLVADAKMQQEYMDYHANQFEQFPEVSAGFCRAEFQRLIMYRNGRQLMLIISYPAGKDYDTLNARTVENNPRVDEWNAIMGKYQEGIAGTVPGEIWVFFEPVSEAAH